MFTLWICEYYRRGIRTIEGSERWHTTEKGDIWVVRDEIEKKRRERRRSLHSKERAHTKKPVFSKRVTIKLLGTAQRHCQHVRCTIYHSLNKSLVMLCCPDGRPAEISNTFSHTLTPCNHKTIRREVLLSMLLSPLLLLCHFWLSILIRPQDKQPDWTEDEQHKPSLW